MRMLVFIVALLAASVAQAQVKPSQPVAPLSNPQFKGTVKADTLQILGSGSTGDASKMEVRAPGETVSLPFDQIFGNIRSAESFGAVGDGSANDTAAFQKISTWMGAVKGRGVVGRTGAVYMVDNWVWPFQDENSFSCPAICTIKARSGGDADYLAATSRYVSNTAFLDFPVRTRNVVFDAAGLKSKAFAVQTYRSRFENSAAINATQDGWFLGAVTRNGTAVGGTGVENKWLESSAYGNGRHGIFNTSYTDGQIYGGGWYNNGGASGTAGYNIYLSQTAGWHVTGVHTYNITSLSSSPDLYLANFGYGTTISGNLFEGVVTVASLENTNRNAVLGPGNALWGGLNATIGNNGATTLTSLGNSYKLDTGQIRHQYFGADHIVRSVSDTFDSATPFVWHNSASPGVIRAEGAYSKALAGNLSGDYIGNSIVSLSETRIRKSLNSSTSTTVVATVVVSKDIGLAPVEVVVDVSGSNRDAGSVVDAFSVQVLGAGARQFQSVNAGVKASVARSVATGSGITFAASAATSGGVGDQTMTFTLTITHPTPASASDSQIEAVARVRGRPVKSITLQ